MATEFESFFATEWPAMLADEHKDGDVWELNAAVLWERAGGRGDWEGELSSTAIPAEAWSHATAKTTRPGDLSWDRRAAWLVYSRLRAQGLTLNESSDLFG